MPIISQDNVYILKSLIKATIKPDLVLTVLQLKTDQETDPRTTCSCCSSAYQVERTIHIFEDRIYKFTYYNEGISYENMIGEVTHIECDPNYPDSGYVEVKAYVDEADIERKVYANIKRIPIANIQDAIDITPYDSPIDKGDDYKLMILGISAQKVRALVINLKMINDNELDQAVKEVSLIVGNKYKVCYNSKENELDCFKGTLTGMLEIPNLDQTFATGYNPNCGFVREDGECKYPEYNKYYLGTGECCCDGCPIAGNCHTEEEISFYNNTYDKDRFLRLPENMVSDVLLTFDITTDEDTSTVYKKIYLSQIRDVCDMYHYEDPASTDLEVEAVNSTLFVYAKNSRIVAIKNGKYETWDEADIKPIDVHAIYPNSYIPTLVNMYSDGQYTVLSEFVDDTRALKNINFTRVITSEVDKINDFVTKLNSWAIGHFVHNGDNTKPLIEASFDEAESTIHINFNYYNSNKYSNAPELLKILDPKEIDSFLIDVVQKSINTEDITINNISIYEDGVLSLDNLYTYIKSIIVRLQEDCEDRVSIGENNYLLHEDDLDIINSFKIDYEITFPSTDDETDFDDKLEAIKHFVTFSTVTASDVGYTKYSNTNILMINFNTGTNLGRYLDNINNDRRVAINHFNIGSFLDIFKSLDVLVGNQYAANYNDLLKIIQRNNRFICHVLCNLKNTKVYKSDGTSTVIVDPCKIFDIQPIDNSYVTYDPQGFYKLTSAFKNLFTDLLDTTNMINFYYPELDTYNGSCLFNMVGTWNIGHIGSIDIPVCINYSI